MLVPRPAAGRSPARAPEARDRRHRAGAGSCAGGSIWPDFAQTRAFAPDAGGCPASIASFSAGFDPNLCRGSARGTSFADPLGTRPSPPAGRCGPCPPSPDRSAPRRAPRSRLRVPQRPPRTPSAPVPSPSRASGAAVAARSASPTSDARNCDLPRRVDRFDRSRPHSARAGIPPLSRVNTLMRTHSSGADQVVARQLHSVPAVVLRPASDRCAQDLREPRHLPAGNPRVPGPFRTDQACRRRPACAGRGCARHPRRPGGGAGKAARGRAAPGRLTCTMQRPDSRPEARARMPGLAISAQGRSRR